VSEPNDANEEEKQAPAAEEPASPPAPYREAPLIEPEDDPELRAAKALHLRIQNARRRASLVSLGTGIVLGIVLCVVLQGTLAEQLGARFGTLALVIVFFAPLLAALKLAELVADTTVKRKIGDWIAEVAREHDVLPSVLEDHARIAGARD
jgi:hypothetical protein